MDPILSKLIEEEKTASNAFINSKDGEKLSSLYTAQENARKALREYKAESYARAQYLNK